MFVQKLLADGPLLSGVDSLFTISGNRPAARLQAVLDKEAKKRPGRSPDGPDGWMEQEVLAMWRATNEERARLGKGPVELDAVRRAESTAAGHIDYAAKFPLYCEDLVLAD